MTKNLSEVLKSLDNHLLPKISIWNVLSNYFVQFASGMVKTGLVSSTGDVTPICQNQGGTRHPPVWSSGGIRQPPELFALFLDLYFKISWNSSIYLRWSSFDWCYYVPLMLFALCLKQRILICSFHFLKEVKRCVLI